MSRRSPIYVPDLSVHVYSRGINRGAIVRDDRDREALLRFIVEAAKHYGVEINAFAVMETHYHMIVTPTSDGALSNAMAVIGGRQTRRFNKKYGRMGTMWNERFGHALLDDERYWYNCLRYVDLNPFRAHAVSAPEESRWCSYRFHAFGEPCDWLTPHPLYVRLGATAKTRQEAYRAMCQVPLTDDEIVAQRYPPKIALQQLPAGA
jgi:putative transposase